MRFTLPARRLLTQRPRRSQPRRLHVQQLEDRLPLTMLLPGFSEVTITSGLSGPTAMDFSPDGRLWAIEQGGRVKLVRNDGTTFTALTKTVDANGERGLLGIAFDPGFTTNHYAYLYYTNPNAGTATWATGLHNQVSRFTVDDTNPLQPLFVNEAPILDLNNLSSATNHNGGPIHFGIDGMLYVNTGDNVQNFTGPDSNTYRVSQTLANMLGKQLRVDVSKFNAGTAARNDTTVGQLIPSDNPFVGTATGINQLIYVLGLRNPFTFAVQPGTGRILINDVGEVSWEEINDAVAGGNYGWSGGDTDGFGNEPPSFAPGTYHDPLLAYTHSGTASLATGSAIVGSTFYNPTVTQFPASYVGKYFYQDLSSSWIRYFDPNSPNSESTPDGNSVQFATGTPGGLRDLKVDAAGNLYFLAGSGGQIRRISFTNAQVVGRQLFYNDSVYDGNNPAANAADSAAIATNKTAYRANGAAAAFASVSSYTKGINGIMVDISGSHGTITANDFIFKMGSNNSPSTWATAPAPTTVTVRAGAGAGGSDRVELLWANGAISNTWLEVVVRGNDALGKSNANAGLATSDVFFFGSAPADSGAGNTSGFLVNSTDEQSARNDPHGVTNPATITDANDFDRNGLVSATDQAAARVFATSAATQLIFLTVGAGGPFAPESSPAATAPAGDSGVASALASARSSETPHPPLDTPPRPVATTPSGPAANYFQSLAGEDSEAPDRDADSDDAIDDDLLTTLIDAV